ncbi:MAG: YdeI/OmpD-associated family protein [Chloroflexi bacterium]|nr:YdeI/OmpD-associated family protein [Chloroflexota bacterium]
MTAAAKELYARDRAAWRRWLEEHHATEDAVWLVFDKGRHRTMSWEDIVQEALCFGWVDSKGGKVSDSQSKLYVSRRKPRSAWSRINKAHVETLTAAGLMTPAGQAAIDEARSNGAWEALDRSDNLEMPAELVEGLDDNPVARRHFEAFPVSSRRIILEWIYSAKRPETRQKRVAETVRLAADDIPANHYRR